MAKLVKFKALDNQDIFVNSETIRAVLPQGGNAFIVYGEGPDHGVAVQGSVQTVANKLIS